MSKYATATSALFLTAILSSSSALAETFVPRNLGSTSPVEQVLMAGFPYLIWTEGPWQARSGTDEGWGFHYYYLVHDSGTAVGFHQRSSSDSLRGFGLDYSRRIDEARDHVNKPIDKQINRIEYAIFIFSPCKTECSAIDGAPDHYLIYAFGRQPRVELQVLYGNLSHESAEEGLALMEQALAHVVWRPSGR